MSTVATVKNNLASLKSEEDAKLLELRQILNKTPMSVLEECDNFLRCCLRVKNYDVSKAAKIVMGVQKTVIAFDEYFDVYDSHLSELIFNQGIITVLKNRDECGRNIFLARCGRWHPKEIPFEQLALTLVAIYIWLVGKFVETQEKGVVGIIDLTNFGWEQFLGAKVWVIAHILRLMQNANPGKIKGVHIIYNSKHFQTIFKLVRPLIKEKLYKRIHFHNQDVASLHMFLKPELLPVSLEGKLSEDGAVDSDLLSKFLEDKAFVTETRRLGLPKF